jgi:hypothetical protein
LLEISLKLEIIISETKSNVSQPPLPPTFFHLLRIPNCIQVLTIKTHLTSDVSTLQKYAHLTIFYKFLGSSVEYATNFI